MAVSARVCFVVLAASLAAAEGARAEAPAAPPLPLEKVVLFTSGVGYFQHTGKVNGDARVEMQFKAENVNDLLKSLVVQDLDGGAAPVVTYASRDPVTKTLETFAVNLTDNPSLADLVGRLRGQAIEIDAATPASGVIVGVEKRMVDAGDDKTVEKAFLTILAKDGLRTLALDSITRLRLVDPRLQAELEKALAVLALAHDNGTKAVTLGFAGKGERGVRLGYVQETPMWKTSYRLVIDTSGGNDKPQAMLQGWAIVENTTDADWKDVRMSLVSGRPISFVMDLYEPLYVPRPVVQPELYASLMPQMYGQGLEGRARLFAAAGGRGENSRRKLAEEELAAGKRRDMSKPGRMEAAEAAPAAMADAAAVEDRAFFGRIANQTAMAQGAALGELFRYEIDQPVTLERQRSAMLPIVGEKVGAEKVSIYDDRVLAKHPLAGVRLVNSTKLNLMQGPVTVYEAGGYAGDARIEDMAPGSERLLSYAVDLDVEVAPRTEGRPEEIVNVRLVKGTLVASRKLARAKFFEIKNSGAAPVKVLVEHPFDGGWKLVTPAKADEKTRDRYRFAVTAEPGKAVTLEVAEELPVSESHAITNLDDNAIIFYSKAKTTSPAVAESLAEVVRRKRDIERIVREKADREREIATIGEEQNRIRENMGRLERQSDLYTRYVKKFTEQEGRIETLRGEIAARAAAEQEARKALDDYLLGLDVK
jgi:hypothetical protein